MRVHRPRQQPAYSTSGGGGVGDQGVGGGLICNYTMNSVSATAPGALSATSDTAADVTYLSSNHTESANEIAAADLETGELHLYSSDVNNFNNNDLANTQYAQADLFDTLTFTNPDATSGTSWQILATFEFDGTSTAGDVVVGKFANSTYIDFGNVIGELSEWSVDGHGNPFCTNNGNSNVTFSTCSATGWVSTVTINVTGTSATLPIGMGMDLSSNGNDIADFSNTASVSFDLPQDVTYTSASGVFMTATAPEPGTLFLAGLALCGFCLKTANKTRRFQRGKQAVKRFIVLGYNA